MKSKNPDLSPKDWELCCSYVGISSRRAVRLMSLGDVSSRLGRRIPIANQESPRSRNCVFDTPHRITRSRRDNRSDGQQRIISTFSGADESRASPRHARNLRNSPERPQT
jgi:hypothetical protein